MIKKYSKLLMLLLLLFLFLPFASSGWINPNSAKGEGWENPENAIIPDENYAQYEMSLFGETTYLEFDFKDTYSNEIRFGVGYRADLYAYVELYYDGNWHWVGTIHLEDNDQPDITLDKTAFLKKARVKIKNRYSAPYNARIYWFQANAVETLTPTPSPTPAPSPISTPSLTPAPTSEPKHSPSPGPSQTPTSTMLPTSPSPTPAKKCTAEWKCRTPNHKSFQYEDCSWGKAIYCKNGCRNGECIEASPTQTPQKEITPSMDCGALKNGECSQYKPFYCKNQLLVTNCTKCGCNKGEKCNPKNGECEEEKNTQNSNVTGRKIQFMYPTEGTNVSGEGYIKAITVKITDPSGKDVSAEKIQATLITDGTLQKIELSNIEKKGIYHATLKKEIQTGTHSVSLYLQDDQNTNKTIHIILTKPVNLNLLFALILSVIITSIGTIQLKNYFKEKNLRAEKQRFEIAKRKRMLKNLKLEFYKRRITEKQYREETIKIQAEIIELQKNHKRSAK